MSQHHGMMNPTQNRTNAQETRRSCSPGGEKTRRWEPKESPLSHRRSRNDSSAGDAERVRSAEEPGANSEEFRDRECVLGGVGLSGRRLLRLLGLVCTICPNSFAPWASSYSPAGSRCEGWVALGVSSASVDMLSPLALSDANELGSR